MEIIPGTEVKSNDPYANIQVDLKSLTLEDPNIKQDDKSKDVKSLETTTTVSDKVVEGEKEVVTDEIKKPENPKENDEWIDPKDQKSYTFNGAEWIDTPERIEIDGTKYTKDLVLEALDDNTNKKKWQTENTKKSQEVAELRKIAEPLVEFIKLAKTDKEFIELVDELLIGKDKKFIDAFNSVFKLDIGKYRSPYLDELDQLKLKNEDIEANNALEIDKKELKTKFNLKDKEIDKVIEYGQKRYEESGVIITLEEAYKSMNYDKLQKDLVLEKEKNKKLNETKLIDKTVGATEIIKSPVKIKDVSQIELGEFEGKLFTT